MNANRKAAEAQLEAEAKNDPEKRKKINEEIWQAAYPSSYVWSINDSCRNVPMPQIRRANQPVNTSYSPGLQILKRPTQSPSPTPSLSAPTKQEEEAKRLERERKYEEARGRIFGSQSPAPETVVTTKAGEKKVWDPSVKDKEASRGGVPIRGPRGPGEGRGFASARGGRRE